MQKNFLVQVTIEASNEAGADLAAKFLVEQSNKMVSVPFGPHGRGVNYKLVETSQNPEPTLLHLVIGAVSLMGVGGLLGLLF